MQERQSSENLNLEQIAKALYDQRITNNLNPDTLKALDIDSTLSLSRFFTFSSNHSFTASETIIFILAVTGFSNDEIAEKLVVSKNTVRFHLKNIYKKTEIESRIVLIKRGIELRLFKP